MKISEVVATYIKLRNKKKELKAAFDAKTLKLDEALNLIENKLLTAYEQAGMESCRTSEGTAYISERSSATVADRSIFMDHVMSDPDNIGLLEVRCSKTAVEAYKSQNNGELPPGVSWRSERTINVTGVRQ